MYKLTSTVLVTIVCWFAGTFLYACYWVGSILAEPNLATYERDGLLPLLGFAVYRLPYLLIGLLIIIVLELFLVPGSDRKPASMI
jgi:hypothetical protein